MEALDQPAIGLENLSEAELRAHRAVLSKLAADIPGTLAKLSKEAQADYDDAAQSVVRARLDMPRDHFSREHTVPTSRD